MSRDYTDEELDLLRANVYADTGMPVSREQMAVMAQLIPDTYIDRLKETLAASGHTVADLDTGDKS
jgi:hypothetical protein